MKKSVSGLLKFSALSAGAAALVMAMKRKKIEPVSLTKKAVRSMKLTIPENEKFENGAALTPPMGWSSWNAFRNTIDEDLLLDVAHAMKESGLVDAGIPILILTIAGNRQSGTKTRSFKAIMCISAKG